MLFLFVMLRGLGGFVLLASPALVGKDGIIISKVIN